MAKGDANRAQQAIDYYGKLSQSSLDSARSKIGARGDEMWGNYQQGVAKNLGSYDEIMDNYRNFLTANRAQQGQPDAFGKEYEGYQNLASGGGGAGLDPKYMGQLDEAIGGYRDFANTGGLSEADISNLRARGVGPSRSLYAGARSNIERQRSLSGGMNSNQAIAAESRLAREGNQAISDANVNVNADIANKVQAGKMFGLTGMSSTSLAQQSAKTAVDSINAQMKVAGLGGMTDIDKARLTTALASKAQELDAMHGMASLYGTTPGLASTFGNQVLQAGNQELQGADLQNRLGLGMINANIARGSMPSSLQSGMGNISSILGMLGKGANLFKYFGGGGRGQDVGPLGGGYTDTMAYDPITGQYINDREPQGPQQPNPYIDWGSLLGGGGGGDTGRRGGPK
jgi:hypothetical protein